MIRNGARITASDGTAYHVVHRDILGRKGLATQVLGTLEREVPKVRGKAARRAEKKARRRARELGDRLWGKEE